MEIRNEFGNSISKSQQKWLDKFLILKKGFVIDIALTRGGYISVDFHRKSKQFPFGREIRGVKAGWISSIIGKEYDFTNHELVNGISDDSTLGVKRYINYVR